MVFREGTNSQAQRQPECLRFTASPAVNSAHRPVVPPWYASKHVRAGCGQQRCNKRSTPAHWVTSSVQAPSKAGHPASGGSSRRSCRALIRRSPMGSWCSLAQIFPGAGCHLSDGRGARMSRSRGDGGTECRRCHLPLTAPAGRRWLPWCDPEPGVAVLAVALYGEDPALLRRVRVPGGWHTQGSGANYPDCMPPRAWSAINRCWDGIQHPVVDATALVTTGRPRVTVIATHTATPLTQRQGWRTVGALHRKSGG